MPSITTSYSTMAMVFLNACMIQDLHAGENHHCASTEKIFFSCMTISKKILSLCGTENNGSIEKLAYRYGRVGKIELSFSPEHPLEAYTYNHYSRYRTDYLSISFNNENYKYSIYQNYDAEQRPETKYGITVINNAVELSEVNIPCTASINKIKYLSKLLPCEKNNALGCYK